MTLPQKSYLKNILFASIIFIIAIGTRLISWKGFGNLDDAEYARFAYYLSIGQYPLLDYTGPLAFPVRLGIIIPTALMFFFFGVSEWSMVLIPFCLSLLSVAVAYYGGKLFFGTKAGIIAAFIWAIIPIESFHASILVPDPPNALFAVIAILLIVFAYRHEQKKNSLYLIWGFAAGLLFGYSWLCKTSLSYLFPFCVFLLILGLKINYQKHLVLWLAAIAGLLTILLGEMFLYHQLTDDFLFRFHALTQNIEQNPVAFGAESYANTKILLKRLIVSGPLTIFARSQYLYLPFIALIGCCHAFYWKDRTFLIPSIWFLSLVFMFNFGSISFTNYTPLVLFERYLYPLFMPAVFITSGFLSKLISTTRQQENITTGKERRFWGILIIIVLIFSATAKLYKNTKFNPGWTIEVKQISKLIRPEEFLYTDILSIKGLEFFWHYPKTMNTINFEDINSSRDIDPGSLVLVNQEYLLWLKKMEGWFPTQNRDFRQLDFYEKPPSNWQTLWYNNNARLYKVMQ